MEQRGIRNEQIQRDHHRYAVSHDHTYAFQGEEELRDTYVYTLEGLELAAMDVDYKESHETSVSLEACEFSNPVEVGKDIYCVCVL